MGMKDPVSCDHCGGSMVATTKTESNAALQVAGVQRGDGVRGPRPGLPQERQRRGGGSADERHRVGPGREDEARGAGNADGGLIGCFGLQ